ncbi:MAG TPA: PqiC family protein [Holophaga sp.]|nr:PqiC family protein [Holophaga sp.]HPS68228.1 PqiC family protein [Holophaga sp.]
MTKRTPSLACLGLLLLGACRSPSPEAVFHTLSPLASAAEKPFSPKGLLALEIMPVEVPELLQRPQVVLADGGDGHRLSPVHRWGNSLEKDMQRVLVENLASTLEGVVVVPSPLGEQAGAACRVSLDVHQCEGAPGGTLRFRATWMATRSDTGRMVLFRRVDLAEPVAGNGIEDLVAAHNRVLAEVGREIARELINLPAVPPP